MIPEKVFQKILMLDEGWQVKHVDDVEKDSRRILSIEETPDLWKSQSCPHPKPSRATTVRPSGFGVISMSASCNRKTSVPCRADKAKTLPRGNNLRLNN